MSEQNKPFVPKTAMDFQKLKLERLMANPDKPVVIPEMPKEKKGFSVPEFVRNVMGSSAGAGSGEFHVYRHLRRKEYTRQKLIDEKGEKERLDAEFRLKLEENKRKMEERTERRRAKRLKRKAKLKQKKKGEKKHNIDKHGKDGTSSEESDSQSEPEQNVDSGDEASTENLQTDSGKEPTADVVDTSTETLQTESEKEPTADNVDTSAKTSQ